MKKLIMILSVCVFLCSCTNNKNDDSKSTTFNELLRTGEFVTVEQMEMLKAQALSWQASNAGMGGFANIVAIEPSDGSNQQVFISVLWNNDGIIEKYEKLQIQTPAGVRARIISVTTGGGSAELQIGYSFISEDSEWIELFCFANAGDFADNTAQWENVTEFSIEMVQMLNELPLEERQFK